MAKYEVTRSFPSYRKGQVVELEPEHRRTHQLVRTGYIKSAAVKAAEEREHTAKPKHTKAKGEKNVSN